ncbi:MAG TPA: glutamate synthase subunit alpha, partial [Candidatus Omnitrophota bacterium]|nr:glutamate synthase subunit alpha [Candidatus Omnitrophota bacterium]
LRTIDEMVGRTDLLELNPDIIPEKARHIDYARILYKPELPKEFGRRYLSESKAEISSILDKRLIKLCEPTFLKNQSVKLSLEINNTNRTVGAMLSGEVCRRCGDNVLLEDTIYCKFKGIAGQSFAAFLAKGITFELEGMANDYVGKGISGGRVIIYPDKEASYKSDENIIIGNTTFYGAITGEAYIGGVAGERFCIRNSGLYAVVEGVGDHGCEYMTGGRVVVLGKTGRNFGAGMSGGIAYVYDENKTLKDRCNIDMIVLEAVKEEDRDILYNLIHNHFKYTKSKKAEKILRNMQDEIKNFVRVIPIEYKRILEGAVVEKKLGLSEALDG